MFVQDFDLLGFGQKPVINGDVWVCPFAACSEMLSKKKFHSNNKSENKNYYPQQQQPANHTLKSGLFWLITRPKSVGGIRGWPELSAVIL